MSYKMLKELKMIFNDGNIHFDFKPKQTSIS